MRRTLITIGIVYVVLIAVATRIVLTKQPPMPPMPSYLPEVPRQ